MEFPCILLPCISEFSDFKKEKREGCDLNDMIFMS